MLSRIGGDLPDLTRLSDVLAVLELRKEHGMTWPEIRRHYPNQWLLIEAIEARSLAGRRFLDDIAVLATYPDSVTAMKRYTSLHREAPQRDLYVCHTDLAPRPSPRPRPHIPGVRAHENPSGQEATLSAKTFRQALDRFSYSPTANGVFRSDAV